MANFKFYVKKRFLSVLHLNPNILNNYTETGQECSPRDVLDIKKRRAGQNQFMQTIAAV